MVRCGARGSYQNLRRCCKPVRTGSRPCGSAQYCCWVFLDKQTPSCFDWRVKKGERMSSRPGRLVIMALWLLLGGAKPAPALTLYYTSAPLAHWSSVACSADGTKIVATVGAAGGSGAIYRSGDSGSTWAPTSAPITNWSSIVSSADGSLLLAAGGWQCAAGPLYISTNSGATWMQASAPISYWCSVAGSADGKRLVAAGLYGAPVISTDFGVTWTNATDLFTNCWSITSSADGQRLAAATSEQKIFVSTDGGTTWKIAGPPAWGNCVCFSGDGRVLVAIGGVSCPIYVSTNSGATWTTTLVGSTSGTCAAASADGRDWVLSGTEYSYISTNYGATWGSEWGIQSYSIASSVDGNRWVFTDGRHLFTSFITSPLLSLSPSEGAFRLSWPAYISEFTLQTASDPALGDWSDVQATPSFSNGQNHVTISPAASRGFFRLRHP